MTKFHQSKEMKGEYKKWRKSYKYYYGEHVENADGTSVASVGEDSELTAYGINHYRNLVKHVLALNCSQKPVFEYRAKNSDLESLQQARLANSIIDSYLTEKRMGRHMKSAAERALVFKVGYVHTQWDTSSGRELMAEPVLDEQGLPKLDDDGQPVKKIRYEGDPEITAKSPWEVGHDLNLRDWTKAKWVWVKEYENKWDLAAQYPQLADQIQKLSYNYDEQEYLAPRIKSSSEINSETDLIPVFYFYHLPSAAVPSGRFSKFLTPSISLYDGTYQYGKKLAVSRITPGEMFDTVDGYSEFYDVMVLQQVLNMVYSTILTNQQAFGVQSIWVPGNANLSSEELSNGMVILKGGDPDSKPQALQLTATPAEIFKNGELVEKAMEKLSGVNSVVRGDPEANIKSGVALGRLQAMAIQFSSNFQQSWAELQEDSGTFLLHLLQNFANTKRMTAIAGKKNAGAMKSWTGKDIQNIERVVCDLANPITKTYAGRLDLADKFLDKGIIKDPTQYFQLIQTGSLDPILEGPTSKLELIRKENEMLLDGKSVTAMVGDSHLQHCSEHRVILDDPAIREAVANGDQLATQIVQNTLAHIQEHQNLHTTQDVFWFAVSGEKPPPPPMPPSPPSMEGSGPQGPSSPLPPPPVGPTPQPEPPPVPPLPPMPNQ